MSLIVVNEPAKEPVSVKEAKDYARIDYTTDDGIIDLLIRAARKQIEAYTGVALGLQTISYTLRCVSYIKDYDLPRTPFQEMVAITYQSCRLTAARDVLTVLDNWQMVDNKFSGEKGTYIIQYKCGLKDIPDDLKLGVLAQVAYQEQNRGNDAIGLSRQAKDLVKSYKLNVWGI